MLLRQKKGSEAEDGTVGQKFASNRTNQSKGEFSMTKTRTKRMLSLLVAAVMVMTLLPTAAFAANGPEQAGTGYAADEIFAQEQGEKVALLVEDDADDNPYGIATISAADQAGTGNASGDMTAQEFLATKKDRKITLTGNVTLTPSSSAVAGLGLGNTTIDLATYQLDIKNWLLVPNGSAVVIEGQESGKIVSTATTGVDKYPLFQLQMAGSLTVNGGTIDGEKRRASWAFGDAENSVTINGGTVTGEMGILTAECCTVTITGGTVKGTTGSGMQNGGEATISGGTVTSEQGSGVVVMGHLVVKDNAVINAGSKGTAIQVNATSIDGQAAGVREASADISGGTITGTGSGGAVVVNNKSKVTITGGTFTSTGDEARGCAFYIMNNSTVDIKNASITGKNSGIFIAGDSTVTVGEGAEIKGGSGFGISTNGTGDKESLNYGANAVININGGTITGSDTACGIYLPAGTANVTAGTVKGGAGIVVRGGDLDVQGGTIAATGTGKITVGDATKNGDRYEVPAAGITVDNANYPAQEKGQPHATVGGEAKVTAPSGGQTLAACKNGEEVTASEAGKVPAADNPFSVSGGTFTTGAINTADNESVDQFLADGYEYDGDNGIQYTGDPAVTLDGVNYESLEKAIAAAGNNSVIKLLKDIEISALLRIQKGPMTIDLNDHSITRKGGSNGSTVFYVTETATLPPKDPARSPMREYKA